MEAIMDRVFIKPDEIEKGSIIIDREEKTKTGFVQSVGSDVKSVKDGDHVIFYNWATLPDDEGYFARHGLTVVKECWILGKIEDE